ncbi:MAG: DUF1501 domain-containing protein, partial [Planctomycetaceae bacterium]
MNISRRQLLQTSSFGFGYLAFSGLSTEAASREFRGPLAAKTPHFTPKAKRGIFLCLRGGPSHVDTFDFKPLLVKHAGQAPPAAGRQNPKKNQSRTLLPSPWKFAPRGKSGIPISDLYPHLSKHADDLCLLNGVHTDIPNHPQALVQLHT